LTTRLYFDDPNLLSFQSRVADIRANGEQQAVALEETAFYPTSGGQPFDIGRLLIDSHESAVIDVTQDDDGTIWHILGDGVGARVGETARGAVDAARRLHHRQQHTGQHLLSAVLWELFEAATVSFHMGDETCTIDINVESLSEQQMTQAREMANRIIAEDRKLSIQYCSVEEARARGARKIAEGLERVRLIEIPGIDLNACGGTHVNSTGEIGCILTRKQERVRQGTRIEFVCGLRAVRTASRDYEELRAAGEVLSADIWGIAEQIKRSAEMSKAQSKQIAALQTELAQALAGKMIATGLPTVYAQRIDDREAPFAKLLGQNLVRLTPKPLVVVMGASRPAATLIIARSEKGPASVNAGQVLKTVFERYAGRGGGSATLAQGGLSSAADLQPSIEYARELLRASQLELES
jgi:alanyl-tRNA synthetase